MIDFSWQKLKHSWKLQSTSKQWRGKSSKTQHAGADSPKQTKLCGCFVFTMGCGLYQENSLSTKVNNYNKPSNEGYKQSWSGKTGTPYTDAKRKEKLLDLEAFCWNVGALGPRCERPPWKPSNLGLGGRFWNSVAESRSSTTAPSQDQVR